MGIKLFGKQPGRKECLRVNQSELLETQPLPTPVTHYKNRWDNYNAHLANNGKTCGQTPET